MSSSSHQIIKDNQITFKKLVSERKTPINDIIILKAKDNNNRWLIGRSNVKHANIKDDIELIIEKSLIEPKYGLKYRCTKFYKVPFIRFDSDGPAHKNQGTDLSIDKLQVPTPHFNTFDSEGKEYAYQTEILENPKEAEAISMNLNFGIAHFCNETNSLLQNGNYPTYETDSFIDFGEVTPFNLNNIKFD